MSSEVSLQPTCTQGMAPYEPCMHAHVPCGRAAAAAVTPLHCSASSNAGSSASAAASCAMLLLLLRPRPRPLLPCRCRVRLLLLPPFSHQRSGGSVQATRSQRCTAPSPPTAARTTQQHHTAAQAAQHNTQFSSQRCRDCLQACTCARTYKQRRVPCWHEHASVQICCSTARASAPVLGCRCKGAPAGCNCTTAAACAGAGWAPFRPPLLLLLLMALVLTAAGSAFAAESRQARMQSHSTPLHHAWPTLSSTCVLAALCFSAACADSAARAAHLLPPAAPRGLVTPSCGPARPGGTAPLPASPAQRRPARRGAGR